MTISRCIDPGLHRPFQVLYLSCLASVLLLTGGPVYALDLLSPFRGLFGDDEGEIIWQDQRQFVKIVEQDWDRKHRRAPNNQQPASISPADLAAVLASLHATAPKDSQASGRVVPAFTSTEIANLAPNLSTALARADEDEDVVFAVNDIHTDLGTRQRWSTAGRAFVSGRQLNIIFGDILAPAKDDGKTNASHYAASQRAGKRMEIVSRDTRLATGPGIDYWQGEGWYREDWIKIDVPAAVAAYQGPRVPVASAVTTPAVVYPSAPAVNVAPTNIPGDISRERQESWRMREEMARVRKEQEQNRISPVTTEPPVTGAPAQRPAAAPAPVAAPPPRRILQPAPVNTSVLTAVEPIPEGSITLIEQRLSTLKSMHDKGLITDAEYNAKRKEILADF